MNIRKETRAARKARMGGLMATVLDQLREAGGPVGLGSLADRTSPTGPPASQSHYASLCRAVGTLKRRAEVVIEVADGGPGRLLVRLATLPVPAFIRLPLDGDDVQRAILEILRDAPALNARSLKPPSDPRSLFLKTLNYRLVDRLARSRADVPRVRSAASRAIRRLSARGLIRRDLDQRSLDPIVRLDD